MESKKPKVGMISLGCPKNLVDSEVMLGLLQEDQYQITPDANDADVMVVNTCAFIEDSKQESVDTILEVADLKAQGKVKKIVVTGCLAQRYQKELEKEMPEVDAFVGTGEFHRIKEVMAPMNNEDVLSLPTAKSLVGKPRYVYDYATPRVSVLPPHTAYVKIAEGCSRTCSFCIIPKLRGPNRSRSIESIVKEAQNFAAKGAKEINLVAQDLTAYGLEREDGANLYLLLRELVKVEGIEWIRLMYNYPMYFSDELIDLIATEDKICSYLDMPLQHIDSDLLASMRRKVDEHATRKLLITLKQRIPNLTLRTTMITGFPGETDAQFDKLYDFVKEIEFDCLGVFTYSQEQGTGAAMMKNQVDQSVKEERKDKLMRMQQSISQGKKQAQLGSTQRILIDRIRQEGDVFVAIGRNEGQAIDIDGNVLVKTDTPLEVGTFYDVKIETAHAYDLEASLL